MKSIEDVVSYINGAKAGYAVDPADSDYQEGYLESLLDLEQYINEEKN
jgi:hypothetical protein